MDFNNRVRVEFPEPGDLPVFRMKKPRLPPAGDGRMWLDAEFRCPLAQAGLDRFSAVMGTRRGQCLRALADRENWRLELPDDGAAGRLERKRYSCSAVMFYWGVSKQYPQLRPHNLFLAGDYRQSFDHISKNLSLPDDPSFYVHAPVRVDPSLAPKGHDTLTAVVPVGHIDDAAPQDWSAIEKRARQLVLQRLAGIGVTDLDEHIKFEVSYTPHDWLSRYNLTKGSTLGLAHNLMQMGYLRPQNRHARYRNLYFVGASTHPGNGVATVLISARLTTERILEDAGVPQPAINMTPTATL